MIRLHSHIILQEARCSIYECDVHECDMYEHEQKFTYMHIHENQQLMPYFHVCNTYIGSALQRGYFHTQHTLEFSDVVVWPPYQEHPTRVRLSHDKVVSITNFRDGGGEEEVEGSVVIYPARHHVTPKEQVGRT